MGYTPNLAPPRLPNKVIMTKHAIPIGKGGVGLCINKIEIIKGFKDNNQIANRGVRHFVAETRRPDGVSLVSPKRVCCGSYTLYIIQY